ncbi:hypothetical protein FA95DRAFT_1592645 [Auriscalpium vulgare]|uniref:Uncharacterized protein n=1 Tax=Auriscalpium vulgare TaxID=40419 RepID=A0ACB8S8R5_9AGAM|nr:hypothetical protein FA95DRAFT_1592645 [Auriscalpium vulgare]
MLSRPDTSQSPQPAPAPSSSSSLALTHTDDDSPSSASSRPASRSVSSFLYGTPATRRPSRKFALPRKRTNSLSSPRPDDGPGPATASQPARTHAHRAQAAQPTRPSSSSGTSERARVPIVVTSPFAAASPHPPFADLMPIRRKSSKKLARKESLPVTSSPLRATSSHDSASASASASTSSTSSATAATTPPPDTQFSTTDRAILAELKRNVAARESQFKMKSGRKHHPYPLKEAPYPRNYERVVIDHDVWETTFCMQLSGSLTFHVFPTPPTKVLDLGCGSGSWILEGARQWRNCEFVGLDLVPLHPDLSHLRSTDLSARITWVQANCLEGLPFPNDEFDFVHVKRIAHGIPEDKWDGLLEEIVRVMKPGAAFEMLEEELSFPGKPPAAPLSRPSTPTPIPYLPTPPQSNDDLTGRSPPRPPAFVPPSARSHHRMHSHSQGAPHVHHPPPPAPLRPSLSAESVSAPEAAPLNPRDHMLLEYIYTETHAARFINLSPISLLANSLPLYFRDVRTHAPIILMFPPVSVSAAKRAPQKGHGASTDGESESECELLECEKARSFRAQTSRDTLRPKQPPKQPPDEPLKVLHGRELMEHVSQYVVLDSSLQSAFPPGPARQRSAAAAAAVGSVALHANASKSATSLHGRARSTFASPSTLTLSSTASPAWSDQSSDAQTSPSTTALDPDGYKFVSRLMNRLPNRQLEFDVRSLNLHLSLRTCEVLACAEAMWEWVARWQEQMRWRMVEWEAGRARDDGTEAHARELLGMSRAEFDILLNRFELDMHDCVGFDGRLADAFHWPSPLLSRTSERRAFDTACAKWDEYRARQATHAPTYTHARTRSRARTDPTPRTEPPPAVDSDAPPTQRGWVENCENALGRAPGKDRLGLLAMHMARILGTIGGQRARVPELVADAASITQGAHRPGGQLEGSVGRRLGCSQSSSDVLAGAESASARCGGLVPGARGDPVSNRREMEMHSGAGCRPGGATGAPLLAWLRER